MGSHRPTKSVKGLKKNFHEKMTKNTTFTEAIRIFSIFLGISDVQIPPKPTFLALWKGFQRSKSAKNTGK